MTPLDDARTLFGDDALQDRKQLRRAYARLVKAHPPDSDPVMFQRVRAAFDAAKDALENPIANASPDDDAQVAALIEGLTEATFEADLARLEALAHDRRDAALAALFLVQATQPTQVLPWLVDLRQRGLPDAALMTLLTALLEVRTEHGMQPLCAALSVTLPPASAATLDGHRVRAGIREGQLEEAFALWRTCEVTLRTYDPATWMHVADAILFFAAERTPLDVLDGIEIAIEDVSLADDEQAHADLTTGLHQARTLAQLKADPRIPRTMVDALRRGQRTSAPGMFSALRQVREDLESFGAGSLSEGMHALAIGHPLAYEMLRDLEAHLTGSRAFHHEWAHTGTPPYGPDEATQPIFAALTRSLSKSRSDAPLNLKQATVLVVCVLLGCTVAFLGLSDALAWWARMLCYAGVFGLYHAGRAAFAKPAHPVEDWISACADVQRSYGLWRYEILAGLSHDPSDVPTGVLDALFDDDEADIRCLSAAHGFRSTLAWQPDAAAADADGADPGEPNDPQTNLKDEPDAR